MVPAELHRFSVVEAHQNRRGVGWKESADMLAISAFQDASGNLKPKELHSSSAHKSWALTEQRPPRIRESFTRNGAFAPETWVLTTETSGGGEKAHRRWPKGRSERGASKAKHRPPRIRGDSVYSRAVFLCASAPLREELDEFGDHFARHPKTAGRTKTGGPVF
jgi:hypothetical protein